MSVVTPAIRLNLDKFPQRHVGRTNGVIVKRGMDRNMCYMERESFMPNSHTGALDNDSVRGTLLLCLRPSIHQLCHADNEYHRVYFIVNGDKTRQIVGYGPRGNYDGELAEESEWYGLGRCCARTPYGQCCNYIDARYSPAATCERELEDKLDLGLCAVHGRVFKRNILWLYEDAEDHVAKWDNEVALFALGVMSRIHSLSRKSVRDWVFFTDAGQRFADYMASIGFYTEHTAFLDKLEKFKPAKYDVTKEELKFFGTNYIQEELDIASFECLSE